MTETNRNNNRIFYILLFFAIITAGFIFKMMSSVILPVIISIMLSFVLLPVINKLRKFHIPWLISCIIVIILFVTVFIGFSSLLANSLTKLTYEFPKYESKFMGMYQIIAELFNLDIDNSKSFLENIWAFLKVRETVQKAAVFLSSGFFSFGKNFFSISLFSLFILIELNVTKSKLDIAFSNDKEKVKKISRQIASDTVRYISIKFFISLLTGVCAFFITWIIGMDSPIIWAFVAFIMNFIPIFGSIISVGLTSIFALLQFYPYYSKFVMVLLFLTLVNVTFGNILEPRVEGKNLGISPFVILVSLSIWGYLWGFVGMILAVPLTVIIKIICENIDILNSIAVLLGNTPEEK